MRCLQRTIGEVNGKVRENGIILANKSTSNPPESEIANTCLKVVVGICKC